MQHGGAFPPHPSSQNQADTLARPGEARSTDLAATALSAPAPLPPPRPPRAAGLEGFLYGGTISRLSRYVLRASERHGREMRFVLLDLQASLHESHQQHTPRQSQPPDGPPRLSRG